MIYVSTGNFKNFKPKEILPHFLKNSIKNIEFSGGKNQKNISLYLEKISKKNNIQIHNYFPPPSKPIIINLASQNEKIIKSSLKLIKQAIDLVKKTNGKFYSFHAGFLADLSPEDLGKSKRKLKEIQRSIGLETFLKNVKEVSNYAFKKDIEILLENNVIGSSNYRLFGKNPFLMTDLEDIKIIMKNTPKNVNLLFDVGHLKVSANTLNFDKFHTHNECKKWIKAYHISENNGKEDTNSQIHKNSWFSKDLKRVKSYTLEVYTEDFNIIKKQIKILKNILNER